MKKLIRFGSVTCFFGVAVAIAVIGQTLSMVYDYLESDSIYRRIER